MPRTDGDPRPRVAIVHDWMLGGGAERVVEQLLDMYPDAPLYTSCISEQWAKKLQHRHVITGYLNWPIAKHFRKFLPMLRQRWFAQLDLTDYDIVISSTGAEAKAAARLQPSAQHICYCHAPTHYYWSRYDDYMNNPGMGPLNPLARLGLRLFVGRNRRWDYQAAQVPDVMVANSTYIQGQIARYYDRDSTVVHPPVDLKRFTDTHAPDSKRSGFIVVGRQTPYKRFDLAVAAATQADVQLHVVGSGPEHQHLRSIAGPTVVFHTDATDADVVRMLQTAEAFIMPNTDDFGVVAIEAHAAGTPVIAHRSGGALDIVEEGVSGEFFDDQTADSLVAALKKFDHTRYTTLTIKRSAERFSSERFKHNMQQIIDRTTQ